MIYCKCDRHILRMPLIRSPLTLLRSESIEFRPITAHLLCEPFIDRKLTMLSSRRNRSSLTISICLHRLRSSIGPQQWHNYPVRACSAYAHPYLSPETRPPSLFVPVVLRVILLDQDRARKESLLG